MTKEKAIEMINEYLLEPNGIHKDWVEALKMCRQALVENEDLKSQIKTMLDVQQFSGGVE